jgi:hypothetical protein
MQIYISRFGERFGPYTAQEVRIDLASGCLMPSDLALCDGMTDWTPLCTIEWLINGQPPPVSVARAHLAETQKL